MPEWLHLVQRIAERYMAPWYNVRYFQVWNELKGYYNPVTNAYDFTNTPGQPDGPNAFNGYTDMYNQVYETLMRTAQSLHIPQQDIKVGGPYVFITTFSSRNQSNPSTITKAYGTLDQRPLDIISTGYNIKKVQALSLSMAQTRIVTGSCSPILLRPQKFLRISRSGFVPSIPLSILAHRHFQSGWRNGSARPALMGPTKSMIMPSKVMLWHSL